MLRSVFGVLLLVAGTGVAAGSDIDGSFDVGGHSLYLHCVGSGAPTIVYFHGYSWDTDGASSGSAMRLPAKLGTDYRFCGYSRANTGKSGKLAGPITGAQTIADLHKLLDLAGVKPPYVLLGASFGGLVAYQYTMTYPSEVLGMVLLDASFPDELKLEPLFPPEDKFTHDEWTEGEEKLDQLDVYEALAPLRGTEPKIPVTYLLAMPSTWTGPKAYEAVVIDTIKANIAAFSPGVVKEVRSHHWMENAVPDVIADEVRSLIASLAPGSY